MAALAVVGARMEGTLVTFITTTIIRNGCSWLMKVFLFAFFIQLSQQSYDANRPGNIMHLTYFTE